MLSLNPILIPTLLLSSTLTLIHSLGCCHIEALPALACHDQAMSTLSAPGQVLMGAASAQPDGTAAALPVMSAEERERVVVAFNSADEDLDLDYSCLHELFQAHARRQPAARCVVCEGEALTYAEARAPGPAAPCHLVACLEKWCAAALNAYVCLHRQSAIGRARAAT